MGTTEQSTDPIVKEEELISRWIEPDPYHPGKGDARLKEHGVHVWALVGYLPEGDDDIAKVAEAYAVPLEAVQAAFAYYRRHKALIEDRIAANAA